MFSFTSLVPIFNVFANRLFCKGKATDVGAEESVISFVQLQSVVSVFVCLYTTVSGVVARGQKRKVIFEFVSFL